MQHTPLERQDTPWRNVTEGVGIPPGLLATTTVWRRIVWDGLLTAFVAEEPMGWHLSISHVKKGGANRQRYPSWDEIAHARDQLLPADIDFVMWLPKAGEYVSLHMTTFHLHEHPPRSHHNVPREVLAVNNRLVEERNEWRKMAGRLATAIDLTRQYVGEDTLPAIEGWSWFDATRAYEALVKRDKGA